MIHSDKRWFLTLTIIVILLFGCDPPTGNVEIYELSPIFKTLSLEKPDTIFYRHELILSSIKTDSSYVKDSIIVADTLVIVDRLVTSNSCSLKINSKVQTLKQTDTISFGLNEAGGGYSVVKLSCDSINIINSNIYVTLWRKRFLQDFSNWND